MDNRTTPLNVLTFRIGDEHYAVNVLDIREVVQATNNIVPVPGTPQRVLGVMNLRGNIITALDLRQVVGLPPDEDWTRPIIVSNIDGHTVGLMVDEVATVTEIDPEKIEPPPDLGCSGGQGLIKGLIHRGDTLFLVIELSGLQISEKEIHLKELEEA